MKDSINSLQTLAKNRSLQIEDRIVYSKRAIVFSKLINNDSIILVSNNILSSLFLESGSYDSISSLNHENLKLSNKLKDTIKMGFASYSLAFYHVNRNRLDSAYYYYNEARNYYSSTKKRKKEADILIDMASTQESGRDFIGSEINAIKAIKILENLPKSASIYKSLWNSHNLVGIVLDQIERFDESIAYHNKALFYSSKLDENYLFDIYSNTNIAILYRRKGDYDLAIEKINELISNIDVKSKDPISYCSLVSNLAYCEILKGNIPSKKIETLLREAIKISTIEDDEIEIMSASEYFSEYFIKNKNKDSASFYAEKAYKIANTIGEKNTVLSTLLLKSRINEGEEAKNNLEEYIKLNDSLLLAERAIRNKFARIEYETEEVKQENLEVKQENQQISKQRLWLLLVTGVLAITLFLLYIIKTQREKNKELELAKKQQEFNEEIYNLMLSQQDKIEQGRAQEKKQISQELHDGVLGRLFGVRLSLDSLNASKEDKAIETRGNYIEELQIIEQDIRKVSHELNTDFVSNSGYFDIIKALLEKQTQAYSLEYSLEENNDINWEIITNKVKMHCYRIIQESLQNIYKHARGTRVDVSFEQKENQLKLIIKDDGEGFDLTKAKKGIGLKNMYARVKEVKGHLDVKTNLSIGTTLIIQVPN